MARKFTALVFGLLLLDFAGCQMAHKSVDHAETALSATALLGSSRAMYSGVLDVHPDISRRFIAIRHKLEILSTDSELPKSLESVLIFCRSIQCELIASNLTARTPDSSASGSITMRVSPQDFPKLFAQAEKQGNIVQHITETEDKTSEVVDTEARSQTQEPYRISRQPARHAWEARRDREGFGGNSGKADGRAIAAGQRNSDAEDPGE